MSAVYDFDLVCIRSGPAGHRADGHAAKLGNRLPRASALDASNKLRL